MEDIEIRDRLFEQKPFSISRTALNISWLTHCWLCVQPLKSEHARRYAESNRVKVEVAHRRRRDRWKRDEYVSLHDVTDVQQSTRTIRRAMQSHRGHVTSRRREEEGREGRVVDRGEGDVGEGEENSPCDDVGGRWTERHLERRKVARSSLGELGSVPSGACRDARLRRKVGQVSSASRNERRQRCAQQSV